MWGFPMRKQAMLAVTRRGIAMAACAAVPALVVAQDQPAAEFRTAHEQFAAGQLRPAANTLLKATLYLRQQVGRSKDETVGMRLLAAESELEKLALGLRDGHTVPLRTFDGTLQRIDRLLAQHHVQLAIAELARPKAEDFPLIASDIRRGAFHFERTFTLDGRAPGAEVVTLLGEVRSLAGELESTRLVPKTALATLTAFERQVAPTTVVAISLR